MAVILRSLDEGSHLSVDVADRAVDDEESLVDVRAHPAPGQPRLGDHVELCAHPVAVDLELRRCALLDDPELRAAIQTAAQVISGKTGLDAHLDANAVRREWNL